MNRTRIVRRRTEPSRGGLIIIHQCIISGYSGDDINKFLWMVRIAEGEHPNEVKEANFMSKHGHYTVDHDVSKTMKNSLMYKLSYYK